MEANYKDAFIRVSRAGVEGERSWFRGYKDVFARWRLDEELVVESSATGMMPCFWYADKEQIIVSTSIFDILRYVRPELDEEALAVFHRVGFFIGDKTPFRGISVLGPSETIRWRNGEFRRTSARIDPPEFRGSYDEALNTYVELFRASMESICSSLPPNFAVFLSGGRDSRHIALELVRLGMKPQLAMTTRLMPMAPDVDWEVAARLCRHFGWAHRVTPSPADWYVAERWQVEASSLMSHEHGWLKNVYDALEEENIGYFFDGVGGGILSAGAYQTLDTPERILEKWKWNGIGKLARPDFPDIGSDEWAAGLIAAHLGNGRTFHFWNRTRRSTALLPFRLSANAAGLTPFVNRELVEFLLSLPLSMTADHQFHDRAIALAHPEMRIAYADYATRLNPMPFAPPRRYALNLLLHEQRYRKQYLKGIVRGVASYAGYNPRVLIYMDALDEARRGGGVP